MSEVISLTGGEPGIDAEARDWVLRLMEAREDVELGAACAEWRNSDPRREAAFWRAWKAWNAVAGTEIAGSSGWRGEAEALRAPRGFFAPGRWGRRLAIPTGLAASVAAGFMVLSVPATPLSVATSVAETRVVALADGSKITVGGKSALKAFTDPKERRVRLEQGQAFFEVAHDPAHPFVVLAGDAEITVRGTKFDVKRIGDDVKVNVLEGRVEVRRRGVLTLLSAGNPDAVLTAGQASELAPDAGGFAAAAPAATSAGEWRTGRLYYADAPLSDIIADARRYSSQRIELAEGVGGLSLTMSYRAGDMEGLADSIEATLPVRVERRNDGLVIVPSGGN